MKHKLTLKEIVSFEKLKEFLKNISFRGLYNKEKEKIKPYKKAKFSIVTVHPSKSMGVSPTIEINGVHYPLFSPQPTIYENQLEIIKTVDDFLKNEGERINELKYAVKYDWEDRGEFHMLPPIIEKHTYHLRGGFIDLDKLSQRFNNFYTLDAKENLHHLANRYLENFFIDEISFMKQLDIFNSNASLINYGIQYNGLNDFYIICDGSHRIDYAIEHLRKPISVILVEAGDNSLIPYYAFPMPFRPTIRLSSKRSEQMFHRLERDKIHLFHDLIKKILHYDWETAGLSVSKLRSNTNLF